MKTILLAVVASLALPVAAFAQTEATTGAVLTGLPSDAEAFTVATDAGVCEFGVESATYTAVDNVTAYCLEEDGVTGAVPLLGGAGAAAAVIPAALAIVIGVAGDNGSGNATGGTN